jgi:pyruvate dehydrogenase E2 component (dihydrolipoamide acetyltransferase)
MAQQIVMPKLGLTMSEGLLAAWLVEEGETVSKGQLLADIETEKIVMQVESPADGILAKYLAEPGDTVPVGEPIAWITQLGEDIPVYTATSTTAPTAIIDEQPPVQATSSSKPMAKGQISPNAKRLARELGVDLSTLRRYQR